MSVVIKWQRKTKHKVIFQGETTCSEHEPHRTYWSCLIFKVLSAPSSWEFLLMDLMRKIWSFFNGDFWICEIHTGSVPAVGKGSYNRTSCGRGGGSFPSYTQEHFSTKEFPHPRCQHESFFRGYQLGAPQHVCFCSLLTRKGDTQACLIHPVVLAALFLLNSDTASLSGPRHEQEPSCATFALKAEEKNNPSLRRLWLRMSLSNIQWGAWDF